MSRFFCWVFPVKVFYLLGLHCLLESVSVGVSFLVSSLLQFHVPRKGMIIDKLSITRKKEK